MPTYSYKCSNPECEATQDVSVPMVQRDVQVGKDCLSCGKGVYKRVFTPYRILNAGLGDII